MNSEEESGGFEFTLESDSHADSPVVGRHAYILRRTGRQVNVSGFSDQLGSPLTVPIVDAAVMYDCAYTGKSYLMVIKNALYLQQMTVTLFPPFMVRLAGIDLNECPKFLAKNPSLEHHSIYFPDHNLRVPFQIYGTISYIPVRLPTSDEVNFPSEPVLVLTTLLDSWDPHDTKYQEQESSIMNFRGEIKERKKRKFIISSLAHRTDDQDLFCEDLLHRVSSGGFSTQHVYSIKTANGTRSTLTPKRLANVWEIGLETARKTIMATTRSCPRNTTEITLNRRYESNDRMLRYKHIDTVIFMDTIFTSKKTGKSQRDFSCVQVYATEFGWVRADMMRREKDIHLSVKSLFKDIGVPSKLIVDGDRAQVLGKTRDLCNLSRCDIIELEKDTPESNRAERCIQILKATSRSDMVKSDSPLVFWCYCIERRVLIEKLVQKTTTFSKVNHPTP